MFVQTVVVAIFALVLGAILCFAGRRFILLLLPVWAFFAGFLVTAQAIQELFGGGFLATVGSWVFGFAVGIGCAFIAYFFYYFAVVVLAAGVGFELGVGIMSGAGVSIDWLLFLVGALVALAVIALTIFLNLPGALLIVLTAEAGASLILTGVLLAVGRVSLADLRWGVVGDFVRASWVLAIVFVLLWAAGIVTQLLLPKERARVSREEPIPSLRS